MAETGALHEWRSRMRCDGSDGEQRQYFTDGYHGQSADFGFVGGRKSRSSRVRNGRKPVLLCQGDSGNWTGPAPRHERVRAPRAMSLLANSSACRGHSKAMFKVACRSRLGDVTMTTRLFARSTIPSNEHGYQIICSVRLLATIIRTPSGLRDQLEASRKKHLPQAGPYRRN